MRTDQRPCSRLSLGKLCSPEAEVVKASVGVGILNKSVEELLERLVDGRRGHGRLQAAKPRTLVGSEE